MRVDDLFVSPNTTLKETMKIIDNTGLNIAFVVDEKNRLLGTATDGDIRHGLLNGLTFDDTVSKVMNTHPVILPKGYSDDDIKRLVIDNIDRFPVEGTLRVPVVDTKKHITDVVFISKRGYLGKLLENNYEYKPVKNILVVGGAGYLGSILTKQLLIRDYRVTVLDNLTYTDDALRELYHYHGFNFINGDIRDIKVLTKAIKNVDAVIHLAAIVGDPATTLKPEDSIQINYLATKTLAEACKYAQVNRFIFASTCSVYGATTGNRELTENSKLNPVSLYAKMKLESERGLLELADGNFSPTILRMGTLYGVSPRMRFDLVVNKFTIQAVYDKKFTVYGGDQWRAFCHIEEAALAYIKCLERPIPEVASQIFNIVTDNMQIKTLGEKIVEHTKAEMIIDTTKTDERNYQVTPEKAHKQLFWEPSKDIDVGISEIVARAGEYFDWVKPKYSNYDYLKGGG